MKIRGVTSNNRKHEFSITTRAGASYPFPYSEADPCPTSSDPIVDLFVDRELGSEALTFVLASGDEGSVHIDSVLEYNEDPQYLAEFLLYELSLEAEKRIENSPLSRRQIARRLNTSVPQLYRLLDPTNTKKSMSQLVSLLHVLNCDVDLVVRKRATA